MRITHSECVFVGLFTQHAMRMRHIISSSVACSAVPYFPTLLNKNVCFDFLYNFVLRFSDSKKNLAIYYHKFT